MTGYSETQLRHLASHTLERYFLDRIDAFRELFRTANKVDDEIAEFGAVVSPEYYGEFQQAIIDADKLLALPPPSR